MFPQFSDTGRATGSMPAPEVSAMQRKHFLGFQASRKLPRGYASCMHADRQGQVFANTVRKDARDAELVRKRPMCNARSSDVVISLTSGC